MVWRRRPRPSVQADETIDDVRAALASEAPPLEKGAHTLVIPTYDRPDELARLIGYLKSTGLESRILVLDSSPARAYDRNKRTIAKAQRKSRKIAGLDIEQLRFSPDLNPYVKMQRGLKAVTSPYCSACADDDFIVVSGLRQCVRALQANRDLAAAHGLYFNFEEGFGRTNVSYLVQRAERIDGATAFGRLSVLMSGYHALFYAVQPTKIARASFRLADRLATTLGREIAATATVAAHGPAHRLHVPYLGRSTAQSISYHAWHPHQILCDRPSALFDDYATIRNRLVKLVDRIDGEKDRPTEAALDIVFLRYLSEFLRHDVLNFVLDQRVARRQDTRTTIDNLWRTFVLSDRTMHRRVPLFDDGGDTFSPGVKHPGAAPADYLHSFDVDGIQQTLLFYHEFFFGHENTACLLGRKATQTLARSLFLYAAADKQVHNTQKARVAAA